MATNLILIVEDEAPLLLVLKDALARDGFDVRTAKDGAEGLALALKEHPDLILLDILMPKMDGIALLKDLRKDPWGKTAKVIVLSNYFDQEKRRAAADAGVKEYWLKADLSLETIVERVRAELAA